jgi:hypothetical protein
LHTLSCKQHLFVCVGFFLAHQDGVSAELTGLVVHETAYILVLPLLVEINYCVLHNLGAELLLPPVLKLLFLFDDAKIVPILVHTKYFGEKVPK